MLKNPKNGLLFGSAGAIINEAYSVMIVMKRVGLQVHFFHAVNKAVLKERTKDMSRRETYEAKAEELILPIVDANGFELVDIEYVKEAGTWYLRVYIDKEGGITIDDCELVSRAFSELLDKEDFIEDSYIMEVSSPGLLRPLKKDKDFERSLGRELEIKTYQAIDGKKDFTGVLAAYDKESITIENQDGQQRFQRSGLALVRPYIEF